jgi:heme/copper-type cytochrome/quinol oxidase subunit 3
MFGLGGLTGLPLGLAATDVALHDTWYVVGHFHYVVAPGTIFAIFAGIYHWFPKVTGRTLNHRLGVLHFWGSFIAMNAVFLPMFTLGLRGVNRRLYDAGQQYAIAQGTGASHVHMTLGALALGLLRCRFSSTSSYSLRRGGASRARSVGRDDARWEVAAAVWQLRRGADRASRRLRLQRARRASRLRHAGGARVKAIPWTYQSRPDTRSTNVRVGVWLFLASETMFFGSLFSAYILLRTGAASWPDPGTFLDLPLALVNTALLVAASGLIAPATAGALTEGGSTHRPSEGPGFSRGRLYLSAALGAAFLGVKVFDYQRKLDAGLYPSTNILLACWFADRRAPPVAAGVGAQICG